MLQCHSVSTLLTLTERLTSSDGDLLPSEEATHYHSIVGGLQYLLRTRPDLSFSVNKVCQYLHTPRSSH
jgi:histone deacetylase 1/2